MRFFFTNTYLSFNIYIATKSDGGCGEGVNTPGCEPGIRQFKSDHPPHLFTKSLRSSGIFFFIIIEVMKKQIVAYEEKYVNDVVKLIANFRVTLNGFKGNKTEPNLELAKEELNDYLNAKYPIYLAKLDDKIVGYTVLRVESEVVWVESLYVSNEHRREGFGSMLYEKAEEYSNNLGNDTLFYYVHPNNETMINFLKSKGYSVLNLIEIRKPFKGEKTKTKVKVGNNEFDY